MRPLLEVCRRSVGWPIRTLSHAIKRKSEANSKLYSEPCLVELGLLNAQHARNQRFAGSELVGRRTRSLRSADKLRFRPDVRSTKWRSPLRDELVFELCKRWMQYSGQ